MTSSNVSYLQRSSGVRTGCGKPILALPDAPPLQIPARIRRAPGYRSPTNSKKPAALDLGACGLGGGSAGGERVDRATARPISQTSNCDLYHDRYGAKIGRLAFWGGT